MRRRRILAREIARAGNEPSAILITQFYSQITAGAGRIGCGIEWHRDAHLTGKHNISSFNIHIYCAVYI